MPKRRDQVVVGVLELGWHLLRSQRLRVVPVATVRDLASAPSSSFAASPPALPRMPWSSPLPAFDESLSRLSALVTYLRTWVASWVATQPRATKKIKPKATTSSKREPIKRDPGRKRPPAALLRGRGGVSWDGPTASDGEASGRPCGIYGLYETPVETVWARGDSNPHVLSDTRP